jgi:hypothetical protein
LSSGSAAEVTENRPKSCVDVMKSGSAAEVVTCDGVTEARVGRGPILAWMVGASTRAGCRPVVVGLKSDPGLKVCLARDPGRSVEGFAVEA